MLAQVGSCLIDCTFEHLNTNLMFKCFVEVLQKFHSVNYPLNSNLHFLKNQNQNSELSPQWSTIANFLLKNSFLLMCMHRYIASLLEFKG